MVLAIRVTGILVAFIGWIVYQLAIKKKKLRDMGADIKMIVFFFAVWVAIYLAFFR